MVLQASRFKAWSCFSAREKASVAHCRENKFAILSDGLIQPANTERGDEFECATHNNNNKRISRERNDGIANE